LPDDSSNSFHNHVFLGPAHERNARKTWGVIALCSVMMLVEIVGGSLFGSLALVADGLHMSTHAAAMLIAALAYNYALRHASDPRFAFGTGKLGDLAAFGSAIILAIVALLIGYEAISRLIDPVVISLDEAIPIAVLGLVVNVISAWLLSGDHHAHAHAQDHGHDHDHAHHHHNSHHHDRGAANTHRDNNIRAAFMHMVGDGAVSVLAILGLLAARYLGWTFMDPMMGIIGMVVIGRWSFSLLRDTGAILLDMTPDKNMAKQIVEVIERDGGHVDDLHIWRLGPGHLGAIVSIKAAERRGLDHYRALLGGFRQLSHLTIEIA
jgi:cation diffusion facilitator family transporter